MKISEFRMFREPGNFKGKTLSRPGSGKSPGKTKSCRKPGAGGNPAAVKRLQARLRRQARLIAAHREELANSRKIFDRASAAANIGVWQCSLPDEALHWTDVVYDMFDLPRGSALDRDETVKLYVEESPGNSTSVAAGRSRKGPASTSTPRSSRRKATGGGSGSPPASSAVTAFPSASSA